MGRLPAELRGPSSFETLAMLAPQDDEAGIVTCMNQRRGRTPAKTVEAIRVDAARRRLEETDDRIESIAEGCGFSSEEQMRCTFLRILRIPPRDYRKRFSSATTRE
jgi:transcriptional regulator GlxA family with amidase domain